MSSGAKTRNHGLDATRGAVVEFRSVGRSFGSVQAVSEFSLSVDTGEFLTLLGPSGSGKTTVLNMVAGFLQPSAGEIHIDGHSVTAIATEKRNIGMVFQNYSLFPHMDVAQNVAFPLKMRRAPRRVIEERVDNALGLVGLGDFRKRMPSQLSGGQRQRVAFARAIVFEPKVLLMDEPLGALDLKLRERMQIEIKHYQQQIGCTVIYVTPRPGRGVDAVRPHRHHERRRGCPGRQSGGHLRPPGHPLRRRVHRRDEHPDAHRHTGRDERNSGFGGSLSTAARARAGLCVASTGKSRPSRP